MVISYELLVMSSKQETSYCENFGYLFFRLGEYQEDGGVYCRGRKKGRH